MEFPKCIMYVILYWKCMNRNCFPLCFLIAWAVTWSKLKRREQRKGKITSATKFCVKVPGQLVSGNFQQICRNIFRFSLSFRCLEMKKRQIIIISWIALVYGQFTTTKFIKNLIEPFIKLVVCRRRLSSFSHFRFAKSFSTRKKDNECDTGKLFSMVMLWRMVQLCKYDSIIMHVYMLWKIAFMSFKCWDIDDDIILDVRSNVALMNMLFVEISFGLPGI